MILYNDTETFSSVNLFTHGVSAYSEAPDAEVMLWSYAIDEGEVRCWDRTEGGPMPADLEEALLLADEHVWQNFFFDATMVANASVNPLGFDLPVEKTWDTMVQAMAHGLPGKLDKLCEVFKLDETLAKDKRGRELINLFCKPPHAKLLRGRATRETHPVQWDEFIEYAKSDIRSMRALRKLMPTWNYAIGHPEHALWQLDQRINRRGVLMDLELAKAALAAVSDNKLQLDAQAEDWTGGAIETANQRDALLAHLLAEYDVKLPDMKGATLERRSKDESLPQAVRDLIVLRMETATTSTSKYKKVQQVVSHDGRARGLLQFCGAGRTGRDAGRLWQPQNLMRPDMVGEAIEDGIVALKSGVAHLVCAERSPVGKKELQLHEVSVPKLAANAMRGSIIAPPGRKLVVSDLKNIEGVTAAWLAGETWKLEAYRAQFLDATLPDMYRLAYGRSFGVDPMSITKAQRQLGKIQELALAYEGGVGAFVTFVLTYRMDLATVAAAVLPVLAPDVYEQALGMLNWRRRKGMTTYGLTDEVFIACEALKYLWRLANPEIASYWKELEEAAKKALANPGEMIECRRLAFRRDGVWLRMILPSGRSVCYPSAHVRNGKIYYQGINQYTHQWGWIGTYGGKIFENACQAFARDVLFGAMEPVESAGYEIIMRVHDEFVCEALDNDNFNEAALSALIIAANENYIADGLPLAASGFEAKRYRKDD